MRHILMACGLATLFSGLCSLSAEAGEADPSKATTSRAAREDAAQSIPFDKLNAESRSKINAVLSRTSIFRRMPVQVAECDPALHLFLIRNPEVVVNIWEVMGISKVSVERLSPTKYRTSDGAGTLGNIEFIYSDHDTHVIYSEGSYDGPLFARPVRGQCVLVLKSAYIREPNGRQYVTNRLDTFIHVDNLGVEIIAKTFQPLVGKSADYNFTETTAFMSNLYRTAESNPRAIQRLAARLTRVEPDVRQKFAELTAAVAERSAEKLSARDAGDNVLADNFADDKNVRTAAARDVQPASVSRRVQTATISKH